MPRSSTRSKPESSYAPPQRVRRSTATTKGAKAVSKRAPDSDEEEVQQLPAKPARTSTSKSVTSRTSTRKSKAKVTPAPKEISGEDESEENPPEEDASESSEPPPPTKRASRKPRSTSAKAPSKAKNASKPGNSRRQVPQSSDEEDSDAKQSDAAGAESFTSDNAQNEARIPKATASKAPGLNRGKKRGVVMSDEDEEGDPEPPQPTEEEKGLELETTSAPAATAPSPDAADEESSSEEDLIPPPSARASVPPPSRFSRGSVPPASRIGGPAAFGPRPSIIAEEVVEQAPKSRLVIHKMALVNFKSYKGRQEIGPFHKSFSSIVGPNGSGKSNTIDALLFVFGYRASKMRQGKLSELIHNSAGVGDNDSDSENESSGFNSCSVEVHFREIIDLPGPDDFTVVPNSKLVVARTAYRNNKSEYTINGKPSNFTEVTTLLKDRGIDLDHKRFLILQGEVESIAQMKPKAPSEHEDGLLEYLEDIIGTSKYKVPIEECNEEVDKLNEERGTKLTRLRHVEKEKSRLEAAKREVEDALRDQNALMRAQSMLAQYYIWQSLRNGEVLRHDIDKLEAKLAQEIERNKDDLAESEALQAQYEDRVSQFDVVKKETAKLVKVLATHEKEEVKLQEKKKHVVSKQKKFKKSLADDSHAKSEADAATETLGSQLKKRKKEIDTLEVDLEKEEAELEAVQDSLKDKTVVFQRQIETKQKELAPWTAQINSKQAEIDLAESERALLAEKATGAQAAVDEAVQALEKLKDDKITKEEELENLGGQQETLRKQVRDGEAKVKSIDAQTAQLRSKASLSRQRVDEAKANQAASTSQNAVLDSLTRLRAAGRIHGFHGRLGSLGTIPDKYDVAISTACPSLNNLVVDTVEQGQTCIEYLRKQNVGRASFLVLEKLPVDGRLDKISTPENAPRLFDLVQPKDPKFAPAFFKGLGNTLVAENLEQANRIAYGQQKRWRVVTLAGQLFDVSGTMSGGGTKVARGGMSSKLASDAVSPAVIKQYEADNERLQSELEAHVENRRTFEAQLEDLQKQLPQVDMAISKVQLDIQTAEKRIVDSEKRIKELSSQSKPNAGDIKRIKALEAEISSSIAEVEKLRQKSGTIESDISSLQDKILEVGGVRLRSQKAKVDGIKQQIDLLNEQVTKAEVGKAKAERDSEKLEATIATATSTLLELDTELEGLDEDLDICIRDLNNIRGQVEKAQEIADSAKEDLGEMKAELDEKMIAINQFRAKEMEYKQKLQDKSKALREDEAKVQHWTKFHDNLELQEIDDDDEIEAYEPHGDPAHPTDRGKTEHVDEEPKDEATPTKPRRHTENLELEVLSGETLASLDLNEIKADVATLEEKVRNAKPNMGLLEEYRKREAEFLSRAKDLDDTTTARDAAKDRFDQLRKTRLDEFMSGFNAISSKLKEMYQMITLGGNAELELVDSLDPFSEGIIFSVMPPKKSWKNISNLSGGEKTLSSLALVFALHVFKPTPLYFMDEIDAALDFRNVSIVANYIKDRTKNAQFIIISLRNDMFELSHRLIGIYKTSNATRSVSIDNHVLTPAPVKA